MSDKIATCVRNVENWANLSKEIKFDKQEYSREVVLRDIKSSAPKLYSLIKNIKALDAADKKKHGHVFKHFIYSDLKSAYGAKLIASALAAHGFEHAYEIKAGARGKSFGLKADSFFKKNKDNVFATLTSVLFFEKPIGVQFRRSLLKKFNERPDNIYGENIRVIILDSGFREGIDLFDVKYVHLFEPLGTKSDEKQAIGRATRYCGQKGLEFDSQEGWPLQVYKYQTIIPDDIMFDMKENGLQIPENIDTFFKLYMNYTSIDIRKLVLANELEPIIIDNAVDKVLTKNVHGLVKVEGNALQKKIAEEYKDCVWPKIKMENGCIDTVPLKSGKGVRSLTFSPTQEFVRRYFDTRNKQKGLLLYHSIGSGKTCSAIATASSSFERENYTILYVTRHTLKADVWKNMFESSCSAIIQDMIHNGKSIPDAEAARKRLISSWFPAMSYKQFSNMLNGNNTLYKEIVKRNGKEDPLRKTFIIIDEAHKLHAPDVVGTEKPDIEAIKKALHHSYDKSGKDSARLLLMTGTPYTDDPIDMVRLMNYMRPASDQLPETLNTFSQEYLDESGKFTEKGRDKFEKQIQGYISYVNREKDRRAFSYPILHEIKVPMTDYDITKQEVRDFLKLKRQYVSAVSDLQNEKGNLAVDLITYRNELRKQQGWDKLKKKLDESSEDIKHIIKEECADEAEQIKDEIKRAYVEKKEELKEKKRQAKDKEEKDRIAKQIKNLVKDKSFDVNLVRKSVLKQKCVERLTKKYSSENKSVQDKMDKIDRGIDKQVEKHAKDLQKEIDKQEARVEIMKKEFADQEAIVYEKVNHDVSQRSQLDKCLSLPHQPHIWLKGEKLFSDDELKSPEADPVDFANSKSNIYLISGHGSENIINFNKRKTMPEDKVLVVFPVCGRKNYMDTACKFMNYFNNVENGKYLANPIKYKEQIESDLNFPIRVYLPGEKVPELSTNLFLDFEKEKGLYLTKSGVFRLGSIPEFKNKKIITTKAKNVANTCTGNLIGQVPSYEDYTTNVHNDVYRGSVYSVPYSSFDALKHQNIKINNILEKQGQGIFYYIGCRSSGPISNEAEYTDILLHSTKQQDKKKKLAPEFKKYVKIDEDDDDEELDEPEDDGEDEDGKVNNGIKASKEDLKLLKQLQSDIDEAFLDIENTSQDKTLQRNLLNRINSLLEKNRENEKLVILLEKLNDNVQDMKYFTSDTKTGLIPKKFKSKAKKGFLDIFELEYFAGKVIRRKLLFVIPINMINRRIKCSPDTIVKALKVLYKKEDSEEAIQKFISLFPTEYNEWAQIDQKSFNEVCMKIRKVAPAIDKFSSPERVFDKKL